MICLSLITILLCLTGSMDPEIRLANRSKVPIEQVRVQFPSQTEEYGTIPPKGVTEYRVVRKAYRYARIEAIVSGEEVVVQPIDYVGEKELKAGKYTYVLTVNEKATSKYDRINLALRKD
jgi:hypothetical protein